MPATNTLNKQDEPVGQGGRERGGAGAGGRPAHGGTGHAEQEGGSGRGGSGRVGQPVRAAGVLMAGRAGRLWGPDISRERWSLASAGEGSRPMARTRVARSRW